MHAAKRFPVDATADLGHRRAARVARFMDSDYQADGIAVRVTELTGRPGDVVLADRRVLHSGAPNTGSYPPMMLTTNLCRRGIRARGLRRGPQVRRVALSARRSAGGSQDVREHPLVDARGEICRFAERQQERAGMLRYPLVAGLPAGEEVHEVAEALHHPGVEWPVWPQERHHRPRVGRSGDPVRPDRELD
jgi:hypothetical protein